MITHFRNKKIKIVTAMANSETDTPMYPVICKAKTWGDGNSSGRALSKMAK